MSAAHAIPEEGFSRADRLAPPAPPVPPRDLPLFEVANALRSNSLKAWPARAYEEMLVHRRFLGVDCFLVNDPVAAKRVLADRVDDYVRPVATKRVLRPGVGGGLLTAEGDEWRAQRKMLAPAFRPQHVNGLVPHYSAAAEHMVRALGGGGRVNLARVLDDGTIDAVGRAMFSMPLHQAAGRIGGLLREYFRGAAKGQVWDFLARQEDDHGWALGARKAWSKRWFAEIETIIRARRGGPARPSGYPDVLDILFEARDPATGAALTAASVLDQVATMVATGFESTARTMFWACYLLARDGDEQAAVREELRRFRPAEVTGMDSLKAWPRLTHVLNETLRLYPPVSTLIRVARTNDELMGVAIRPGAFVVVCPWVMHRHKSLWDRPEAFMPERFAQNPERLRDGAYIPFGAGRRVCIGAAFATTEATLILARLLSRFEVRLDDARVVMPVATATTGPNIEPWFRLEPIGL